MRQIEQIKEKRKIVALSSILICTILAISIFWINAHAELTPIKTITIESEKTSPHDIHHSGTNYFNGAWTVTKSAEWVDYGKAEVTYELKNNYKYKSDERDIVFIIEKSRGMEGNLINTLKDGFQEFIHDYFSVYDGKIAIINFADNAYLAQDFTNDENLLMRNFEDVSMYNFIRFNDAFIELQDLLERYNNNDRHLSVVLISRGMPSDDISTSSSMYKYIKDKYPNVSINGITYKESLSIGQSKYYMEKITDDCLYAEPSSLVRILYMSSGTLESYSEFNITDFIDTDYFNSVNIEDIKPNVGTLKKVTDGNEEKIIWDFDNGELRTGTYLKISFNVKLKDELLDQGGIYPISKKEVIKSSLYGNPDEDITSNKTPILADNYKVYYDGNNPGGCTLSNVPSDEKATVYKTVKISNEKPVCNGYQFKGWRIATEHIKMVNDETFLMPESDVIIRAEWTKLSINKSMDGTIKNAQSLYGIMRDNSKPDNVTSTYVSGNTNGIDYSRPTSDTNGKGIYMYSPTANDEYPVYFYRGDINNNNVKFANYCWKAVITTSTGGVKLIYNGPVNNDGTCPVNSSNIADNVPYNGHGHSNGNFGAIGYEGYMYGTTYDVYTQKHLNSINNKASSYGVGWSGSKKIFYDLYDELFTNTSQSNADGILNHYYSNRFGDSVTYSDGKYHLSGITNGSLLENYNTLKGKYMCPERRQTECSEVYYLVSPYVDSHGSANSAVFKLEDGNLIDYYNKFMIMGKSLTSYGNGFYALNQVTSIRLLDWYENHASYEGMYTCGESGDYSCYNPQRIGAVYGDEYYYINDNDNILFAKNVEYSNGKYILQDTKTFYDTIKESRSDEYNNTLNDYRYTCYTNSTECSTVYYMLGGYMNGGSNRYAAFMKLADGSNYSEAVSKMQTNTRNSTAKSVIDLFYSDHLTDYSDYIEDTVYCNDRRLSDRASLSTSSNRTSTGYTSEGAYGYFRSGERSYRSYYKDNIHYYEILVEDYSIDLSCRQNDSFTVSSSIGNGKLTYPIAMLTADEYRLAGGAYDGGINVNRNFNTYLNTGNNWWLITPHYYGLSSYMFTANPNPSYNNMYTLYDTFYTSYDTDILKTGLRPVISIKHDIPINGGDGTTANPYEFKLN